MQELRFTLPEKSPPHDFVCIQQVQQGICVLAKTGSKNDNFEACSHLRHEAVHVWPFKNIHLNNLVLNLDRYDEVWVGHRLEGGMHQRLVQVEHKTLFVLVMRCCWPYHRRPCHRVGQASGSSLAENMQQPENKLIIAKAKNGTVLKLYIFNITCYALRQNSQ